MLCDGGSSQYLFYLHTLKLKRPGISAQNPRSPSICGDIASASLARSLKPSSLLRERGEETGTKGSSYAAATTTTYSPSILLYLTLLLVATFPSLLPSSRLYCSAHPLYSHALASFTLASSTPPLSPLLPPVMPAMPLDEDKRRDSRREDAHRSG